MTTVPDIMKAIEIAEPGDPSVLVPRDVPVPVPEIGEILVQVAAAGVNRPDVLQRKGAYPPPPGAPAGPGLEVSGTVVAVGDAARRFSVGQPVCALTRGAGYAEYAVVDERHALPVPTSLSLVEAAGLPETCFTVWHNVFERGRLQSGETLLVHGGSSGIGTTAIQIAAARGATVFATAGTAEKCAACISLGARAAINYREEDFVDIVKAETSGAGVDVILDMVGGAYIARNHAAAAMDGRIVQIAFLDGARADIDFTRLMIKRLTHTGSTMRPQSADDKARIADGLKGHVWPLIETGAVKPVIYATVPLSDAATAHQMMEDGDHIGKIILTT